MNLTFNYLKQCIFDNNIPFVTRAGYFSVKFVISFQIRKFGIFFTFITETFLEELTYTANVAVEVAKIRYQFR